MVKVFIGVDGEMTGVPNEGQCDHNYKLIQIGVAMGAQSVFTSDIGWEADSYDWSERAFEVNGFDHKRVTEGPPADAVDEALWHFLTNRGVGPKEGIAVGWNVAHFDFAQFIYRTLPKTSSLFGYRFVDLNSICFAFQHARDLLPPPKLKGPEMKFDEWKNRAKAVSGRLLGPDTNWHDAGYDAAASLLQFQWLAQNIGNGVF